MVAPITRTPTMTIADVPPVNPLEGDLWWSTITGQQSVWFDDGSTTQWVVSNWGPPSVEGPEGPPGPPGTSSVIIKDTPPDPAETNQLWWSSILGQLFVWYNDGNTAQWVQVAPSPNSGNTGIERSVAAMTDLASVKQPYPNTVESAYRTAPGDGGGGVWTFTLGDQSAMISTQDPGHGLWVAPSSDPTGASGAWRRRFNGPMRLRWFGAKADGATNDKAAIDNAIIAQSFNKIPLDGENLLYASMGQHRPRYAGVSLSNTKFINLDHVTINTYMIQCDLTPSRFIGQIVGNTLTIVSYVLGPPMAVGMRITDFSGGRVIPCYTTAGSGLVWTVDGNPQTTTVGDTLEGYLLNDGVTLKNIKINRNNMIMSTASTTGATIAIQGYKNVLLEDIDIFGDGCGKAIQLANCVNSKVIRPHIHDMAWVLPANPGSGGEQINGIFVTVCGNTYVEHHVIEHLQGYVQVGAGPKIPQKGSAWVPIEGPPGTWTLTSTYQNTDGLDFSGSYDSIGIGGYTIDVGEGSDCSGARSVNTLLIGNSYYDCNGYSEKTSSEQWKYTSIGARSYRAGLQSFVCAGTPSAGYPSDISWIDAQAFETAFYGAWFDVPDTGPGSMPKSWNTAGFGLENDSLARIRLIDCKSLSTTAKYAAALNDGSGYIISNFDATGFTVSKFNKTTPLGYITEINPSPTGFKSWSGITSAGRIVGVDIHAGDTLTVDGDSTLTGSITSAGGLTVSGPSLIPTRFFETVINGGSYNYAQSRNDDSATSVALLVSNHNIAGTGVGVQQRATLGLADITVGDAASIIETVATEDWTTTANKTAEMNVSLLTNGAQVEAYTADGTQGITSSLGLKSLGKTAAAGVGYGTGAGVAVVQATNKSTAITANGMCGTITMAAGSLAAGTPVAFVVNNSSLLTTDFMIAQHASVGTISAYAVTARITSAGVAAITVRNLTAGALDEQIVISFMVFRSAIS